MNFRIITRRLTQITLTDCILSSLYFLAKRMDGSVDWPLLFNIPNKSRFFLKKIFDKVTYASLLGLQ